MSRRVADFLHGLLAVDDLFASGGLRMTDTATGTTLLPGCCNGLDERRDWLEVVDGAGWASFGHDPSPLAERDGEVVRLTVEAEHDDSPVMEVPVTDLRRPLAGAEQDLIDFLQLAAAWAARHLPVHAAPVASALGRALDLPDVHGGKRAGAAIGVGMPTGRFRRRSCAWPRRAARGSSCRRRLSGCQVERPPPAVR